MVRFRVSTDFADFIRENFFLRKISGGLGLGFATFSDNYLIILLFDL